MEVEALSIIMAVSPSAPHHPYPLSPLVVYHTRQLLPAFPSPAAPFLPALFTIVCSTWTHIPSAPHTPTPQVCTPTLTSPATHLNTLTSPHHTPTFTPNYHIPRPYTPPPPLYVQLPPPASILTHTSRATILLSLHTCLAHPRLIAARHPDPAALHPSLPLCLTHTSPCKPSFSSANSITNKSQGHLLQRHRRK